MDTEENLKAGPAFLPGIDLTLWLTIGLGVALCLALLVTVIVTV